jgi:hypothetical protein
MRLIIVLTIIFNPIFCTISTNSISCPSFGCDADIGDNVCYIHSESNPVTYIKMYSCPTNYICDISNSSEYAWINSQQ